MAKDKNKSSILVLGLVFDKEVELIYDKMCKINKSRTVEIIKTACGKDPSILKSATLIKKS